MISEEKPQHCTTVISLGSGAFGTGCVILRKEDVIEVIKGLDGIKRKLRDMINTT